MSADTNPPEGQQPLAVDLKQAAKITGLSVETLRRSQSKKELAKIVVGRRVLIPYEDLRRFLNHRKQW